MSRIIKFILILPIILVLAYCGLWFGGQHVASKYIEDIKGKEIELAPNLMGSGPYSLSFKDFEITGFPFNINMQINGVSEIRDFGSAHFTNPLEISYNMVTGGVLASYSGDVEVNYNDVASLPGEKMSVQDYKIRIPLPSVISLAKFALQNKIFEAVNYINSFALESKKIEISSKSGAGLYVHDGSALKIKIKSKMRYKSLEDIKTRAPSQIDLAFNTRSSLLRKKPVPHQLQMPVMLSLSTMHVASAKADMRLKPATSSMDALLDNFDLDIKAFEFDGALAAASAAGKIKSSESGQARSYDIDLDNKFTLKKGYFEYLRGKILSRIDNTPAYTKNPLLQKKLKRSLNMFSMMGLERMENTELSAKLDTKIAIQKSSDSIELKELSIQGAGAGARMRGKTVISKSNAKFLSKGDMEVKNYKKLLDAMMDSQYFKQRMPAAKLPKKIPSIKIPGLNLGGIKIPGLGEQVKKIEDVMRSAVYAGAANMSNKKASSPADIAFDYHIDSDNIAASTIGNWSLGKFLDKAASGVNKRLPR